MGLCVCRGVSVYTAGRREEGEGKGGGVPTAACAGAYVRAGAGPGCGEQKTKGLLRFPPARAAEDRRREGALQARAPEMLSLPGPLDLLAEPTAS